MKLDRFLTEGAGPWQELSELIAAAKGKPERLGPQRVRRLVQLYRRAVADLSFARRAYPHHPVVGRLSDLVARSRPLVYGGDLKRTSLVRFFTTDYWRLIRERPWALAISAAALLLPLVLGTLWSLNDAPSAVGMVPNEYRAVLEPRDPGDADLDLSLEERFGFAGFIFTNNVRVSFLAFASGVTAGIGTGLVLIYNGTLIGVLTGLAIGAGGGPIFAELVLPHGVLELSCIIVAGAAGIRVGWALVDPGRRRRRDALVHEARPAVLIALGTAPWLVLAGFIEGLVTPTGIGVGGAITLGTTLGAIYWTLVIVRGRPQVTDAQRP